MTRETAEALAALLKGIGFAMFFCIGLGGILIANNFTMVWVSLIVVAVCWVASNLLEAYADQWEDENLYDN